MSAQSRVACVYRCKEGAAGRSSAEQGCEPTGRLSNLSGNPNITVRRDENGSQAEQEQECRRSKVLRQHGLEGGGQRLCANHADCQKAKDKKRRCNEGALTHRAPPSSPAGRATRAAWRRVCATGRRGAASPAPVPSASRVSRRATCRAGA